MATSRCSLTASIPTPIRSRASSNLIRGRTKTVWEYRGKPSYTFFSPHISGAQRLPSGHTLICEGQWGRLFEVTPEGEIVWEYVSPFMGPDRNGDPSNEVFRAYRYAADSPQIRNRLATVASAH